MSSAISRFLVLAFARLTNYAILLVSPIVFVRILDQHAYGQYREFVVYAPSPWRRCIQVHRGDA